ncbi:secretin N-terminal domain-containing protein [uncultured Paraglaciecola sp.]|uniref:secretin N-terminal domain-containing protein n=1 Tax=uncultured Paraglaciecola sp. TaxID=1765024 RepID=UPI0025D4A6BD|nr:secretin N-terminal domain-containing protein [uncultured Paraglaciecola sp.]
MKNKAKYYCSVLVVVLTACSALEKPFTPDESFLASKQKLAESPTDISVNTTKPEHRSGKIEYLSPYQNGSSVITKPEDLAARFSQSNMLKVTADELPLKDFLHYVFGDLLDVSYILGDELQSDTQPITLNIRQDISKRKLFLLSEELLVQRNYVVRVDDGIFYIHKAEGAGSQGTLAYGYGKRSSDVPNSSSDIIQMVPLNYGLPTSFANSIRTFTKVTASPDFERSSIVLQGKRRDILKGLEFINLMDQPKYQGRQIGLYQTTFISIDELSAALPPILEQEGLIVSTKGQSGAISLVPLSRQSLLIMFANDLTIIDRVSYWASKLDKPATGSDAQYFIYNPNYARATDLGESLSLLIGGQSGPLSNSTSAAQQNNQQTNTGGSKTRISASSEDISLVVDERSNSLIFKTTGSHYQSLLPLIKRLDVLPKQIMLEVVIAEVSLTDEFKQGVEFALNDGNYGLSTEGAFFGEGFGGLAYALQGTIGQLALNLFQSNSLVNIISRPSLVVRDGVRAAISVGTDIPVVGQTSSDPINGDRQTTSIEYRKTGVELEVTPSVNAQGYVIMSIKQTISNEVDSGGSTSAGGNPSLFERTIDTEVVAQSGRTIILGGLISENKSSIDTQVPLLGDIPLLGNLFKAKTRGGDKTELVLMVTPRIIESSDEWDEIRGKLSNELKKITIY